MGILKKNPSLVFGLSITVLFLILGFLKLDFLESLELKFYDYRMKMRSRPEAPDEIVLVDIDNDSIEKLGRWPWPRSRIATCLEKINAGGPKIVGLNIIYSEPEDSAALEVLDYISKIVAEETGKKKSKALEAMTKARSDLDNDKKLAASIEASGNVVLPVFFEASGVAASAGSPKKEDLFQRAVKNIKNPKGLEIQQAQKIVMPIPSFFEAARNVGHVNLAYDSDGIVRREHLLYEYHGRYIPSFTLRLAALFLGVPNDDIRGILGESIQLGRLTIPTNARSEMLVSFKGPTGAFKNRFSFFDVVNDKIPSAVFQDKIVMINPSAPGIMNPISTPVDQVMPVGEFSANSIWAMLNENFVREPGWNPYAQIVMILLVGALITFALPRLKAVFSALAFVVALALLIVAPIYLFVSKGLWIHAMYPVLQIIIGYIGVASLNFFVTESYREKAEGESAETNRMLGLSFQSQGMLDMAFDKFKRVPVDEEMKSILYNLGLDFERKRQLNKAASVYEHIEQNDPNYKDAAQRRMKLLRASDTMVFGEGLLGGGTGGDDLIGGAGDTRPTLGRYEIQKQLGKGAMGVVYLGQDPRINRTTAIKTFKFAEDFEPEEAKKMTERFFREAESAGTLSHPNIVTIYDAGEEQDLAYIAMEYLEGEDLQKYTKKGHLPPMRKVLDYVADLADALDYAHGKGIVHRDIKPANLMLLKSGIVKVTDFGIARITASSQTQTGVVKGTPHYMSPEQISGKKVDGRSDIFSLGVVLYQLLTGGLPFRGDSPAALMHQIMNTPHPDPRKLNPKLSKAHVSILNKALEKDRNKRYQKASAMADHLRILGQKIDALMNRKKAGGSAG